MRLWSIHPRYLDAAGLTACWREGLLARKVLSGATKGYRAHPQLIRFRLTPNPMQTIDTYLNAILAEAAVRGYHFDGDKISKISDSIKIPVTEGQLAYEFEHLKQKLAKRHPAKYAALLSVNRVTPHPMFLKTQGGIENWEIIK